MINLRYHIVSITAVFLALAIGLAFGASFIEQATVGTLENNLNDIERQNDALEAENGDLRDRVALAEEIDAQLRQQGLAQIVAEELAGVPVLVLANAGVADDLVAAAEVALLAAGAETPGVLRVTDRFALDDEGEIEDLRGILGLPNAEPAQLRVAVTRQVATLLRGAAAPVEPSSDELAAEEQAVPPLLEALVAAGFLELDAADAPAASFALLPPAGLRIVAISSTTTEVADDAFLRPVIQRLATPDPTRPDAAPPVVVATQPTVPADTAEGDVRFIDPFRADEVLRVRTTTVDDLELFAGLVAVVLSVAHGGEGQTGHYGLRDDAQSLLPPALVVPEEE